MTKLFFIIGAPGSGKTTDASIIAKEGADITHYSTGDLLRDEVASGSELGKLINGFISKGELVPLTVVIDTIVSALKNSATQVVIIDGYPRSVEQMMEFDKVLQKNKEIDLRAVIEVQVSEQVAKDRVLGRSRGDDDNEAVFNNRMRVFTEPLSEIRKFYSEKKVLYTINGERSIEEIVAEMKKLIQKLL
ncbi:adenylate kinase [Campylobacter troglodytis]|uniref:adenylate kinase n=1 Tax=Campylobacter troglodytis TaxID=654363 RepID=UPI001159A912|nr:adenylate kinase [Campylobacter troglodytis]TQR60580.1 adenylate kinase [Campylobacter troglodytis]